MSFRTKIDEIFETPPFVNIHPRVMEAVFYFFFNEAVVGYNSASILIVIEFELPTI